MMIQENFMNTPAISRAKIARVPFWMTGLSCLLLSLFGLAPNRASADIITDFFTIQQGTVPVIFTAPHGGTTSIPGIPTRVNPGASTVPDVNTNLLAQEINERFFQLTGKRPYVVIAQAPRAQIDFNRAEGSSAFEVEAARPYHQYYHNIVRSYVDQIRGQWTNGLLIDIHGHGVSGSTDVIFRGTRNGDTVEDMLALHGEVALNGPNSFLGKLAALGHTVDPDVSLPLAQQSEEDGLTGAFTVFNYGSQNSNGIDAIQFELGRDFRFGTAWQTFAPDVALAANAYRTNFLSTAAIPEPASFVLVFSMSVFITTRRLRYRLDAKA